MKRLLLTVTLVTIGLACDGAPARAHAGHTEGRVVVSSIAPPIPGVAVTPVVSVVGKLAVTSSRLTVAVLGTSGQPIFRVGPGGVEANAVAPEWFRDNEPLGIATVPPAATPSSAPQWMQVAIAPRWEWFDHRLHPATVDVTEWEIPIVVDGQRHVVRGRVEPTTTKYAVRVETASVPSQLDVRSIDTPAPALTVRNTAAQPVDVLGEDGEVFVRLSTTESLANRHSPLWGPTAQVANRDLLSTVLDPAIPPDFIVFRPTAEASWPDPRLLPGPGEAQRQWRIPVVLTAGASPIYIEGITVTAPILDPHAPATDAKEKGIQSKPAVLIAEALALAGLVALVVAWRRRSTRA